MANFVKSLLVTIATWAKFLNTTAFSSYGEKMYALDLPQPLTAKQLGENISQAYYQRTGTPTMCITFPHQSGDETQMVFWDDHFTMGHFLYHVKFPVGARTDVPRTRFEVVPEQVDPDKFRESVEAVRQLLAGKQ